MTDRQATLTQTSETAFDQARMRAIIDRLERRQIIDQLRAGGWHFPVDFTSDWLDHQPLESLRHVFAALCLQCRQMPAEPARSTAA